MDLLEYQAKELFHEMGIPVLPSQRIDHPRDLKGLRIPYPVVLKSQVYTSGRAKAGGIKFVENTIDAVAAAQSIFNLAIMGQYPRVLLAEAKYDPDQEFYLAVLLDRSTRRPVLLGSQQGGVNVESALDQMRQVVVDQEFSPFYARRLALKMAVQGPLIQSVSDIVEKMYQLFVQKDLDLVEINPLAVSSTGEIMALDGRVAANDDALNRHSDLVSLKKKIPNAAELHSDVIALTGLDVLELDGNIGILCNGAGLTMATLDMMGQAGGKTAYCINLGSECRHRWPPTTLIERLEQGLGLITQNRRVKAIFIHILGNSIPAVQIAEAIARYLQKHPDKNYLPALVVRLVDGEPSAAASGLAELNIPVIDSLDTAIAKTVALTKSK